MTARRWQNLAKYFLDFSKIIFAVAVIGRLVAEQVVNKNAIALAIVAGILFFIMGLITDRKGDENESC